MSIIDKNTLFNHFTQKLTSIDIKMMIKSYLYFAYTLTNHQNLYKLPQKPQKNKIVEACKLKSRSSLKKPKNWKQKLITFDVILTS